MNYHDRQHCEIICVFLFLIKKLIELVAQTYKKSWSSGPSSLNSNRIWFLNLLFKNSLYPILTFSTNLIFSIFLFSLIKEREETERISKLTPEERRAEARNNPKEVTNQKQKGKYKFLQKYYHRGAFFMVSACLFLFLTNSKLITIEKLFLWN